MRPMHENRTPMLWRDIDSPRYHCPSRARGGPNTSGRDLACKLASDQERSTVRGGQRVPAHVLTAMHWHATPLRLHDRHAK